MNQMGRSQIGYRNDQVPWYYAWNPGGCGCSGGCDGCWAKAMAGRMGPHCDKCKAFEVHLHEERLRLPACTSPPGVVLVNFTCDTFDMERPLRERARILRFAQDGRHHNYVWLTKNGIRMALDFKRWPCDKNWWLGLSVCTDQQAKVNLPALADIASGHKWLSVEPLWEHIDLEAFLPEISGVIVGHDNRKGAPGTGHLGPVYDIMRQCDNARVPLFVKQLWINDKLEKEPENFPEDLQLRELPWSMPEVKT